MNELEKKQVIGLLFTVFSIFFLNPFLTLLLFAIFSLSDIKVSQSIYLSLFVVIFSIIFINKEYGVSLSATSHDDVNAYILIYNNANALSVIDIIYNYMVSPLSNEMLWMFFSKMIGFFNVDDSGYVQLVYILQFTLYAFTFYYCFKERSIVGLFIFICLSSSASLIVLNHVWRQSFMFCFLLISMHHLQNRRVFKSILFFLVGVLIHTSAAIYYIIILLADRIYRCNLEYYKKILVLFVLNLALVLLIVQLLNVGLVYWGSEKYLNVGSVSGNTSILVGFVIATIFAFSKNLNKLEFYTYALFMWVSFFVIFFPGLYSIYTRFVMVVFPLIFVFFVYIKNPRLLVVFCVSIFLYFFAFNYKSIQEGSVLRSSFLEGGLVYPHNYMLNLIL